MICRHAHHHGMHMHIIHLKQRSIAGHAAHKSLVVSEDEPTMCDVDMAKKKRNNKNCERKKHGGREKRGKREKGTWGYSLQSGGETFQNTTPIPRNRGRGGKREVRPNNWRCQCLKQKRPTQHSMHADLFKRTPVPGSLSPLALHSTYLAKKRGPTVDHIRPVAGG